MIKEKFKKHYAVFCPICNHEISIYSYVSHRKLNAKCNNCKANYTLYLKPYNLVSSNNTDIINDEILKYDKLHQHYDGVLSSEYLMPIWMKKLFKF